MNATVNGTAYKAYRMDGATFLFDGTRLVYEVTGNRVYCYVPAQDGRVLPVRVEGEEAADVVSAIKKEA